MRTTRARDRAYAAELATFGEYVATTGPALSRVPRQTPECWDGQLSSASPTVQEKAA
jgi:hypothetical protein